MEKFQNLPAPVKWALGLAGVTAVTTGGFVFLGKGFLVFLGILAILLVLFLGAYFAWKAWVRKKKSARLGGQLQQHGSAAPRDITDPGKRARLDDLRRKFEDGVREYKARGKDLYKLPWYVIVGPPASGKTEAIRHSNVGFPPGMQDPLQGVGGTINMNWWFTNQAVILDTAGRLMFEEVKPGETSEWREFLNLLKKNRPNCPINGLILTISIDSLIKDSSEQIEARAGKIAQQLDLIQRVLDVRFPVYVIVTKSDLLTGFREFFNGITDPHLQHQMMGWSNPDPLDTPFRPDQIDQHLESVLKRLRRRRLGLLRDPVSESSGRRTDEVDSLFALPNSFSLIAPRLRRYLETIFVAGEWSSKPLFLRGIYFTSSMREGSALDQELAQSIGISVDELPSGPAWERERAFFLRDLFLEKVFKERGLVTRATSTAKLLRGRQTALYGTGFAALIIFIFLFIFGMRSFRNSVGDQTVYWQAAAESWDRSTDYWVPLIATDASGKYQLRTNLPINLRPFGLAREVHLAKFHSELKEYARQPLQLGVFAPIAPVSSLDSQKRKAQRIVFEGSVLRPIIQAARQKLQQETQSTNPRSVQRQSAALAKLVELEADILKKDKEPLTETRAAYFLDPFLEFLQDEDVRVRTIDPNISQTMAWIYSEGDGREHWPPPWLSGGPTLARNQALSRGLDRFLTNVLQVMQVNKTNVDLFNQLNNDVKAFAAAESQLAAAKDGMPPNTLFTDLSAKALALNGTLERARQAGLVQAPLSLRAAYQKVTEETQTVVDKSLKPVRGSLREGTDKNFPLFDEIGKRLDGVRATIEEKARKQIDANTNELHRFDEQYLDDSGAGVPLYALRMEVYKLAYDTSFLNANLIGENWKPLLARQTNAAQLRAKFLKYQGKYAAHTNLAQTWLDRAETAGCAGFREEYVKQIKDQLLPRAGFPLVKERAKSASLADLKQVTATLARARSDFADPACRLVQNGAGQGWTNFTARLSTLTEIATAVVGTNQVPGQCKMILAKPSQAPGDFRGIYENMNVNRAPKVRARGQNADIPLAALALDEPITINLYRGDDTDASLSAAWRDWGVFKLLLDHADGPPRAANSRNVKLPLKAFQTAAANLPTDGHVSLVLEFNYPLPEIGEWPTQEDLRKLSAH